jgi:hypothetical protein
MRISYKDLIKDYYENLNTNLRNFKGGPGFLESWVHDENHNRSIVGMIDLAIESDVLNLELVVDKAVISQIDLVFLQAQLKKAGTLTSAQAGPDEFILTFRAGL